MALYESQFKLSGSEYGLTFVRESEGRRAHVRQKSSLNRDKWLRAKAFVGARAAATEFGGASALSARIYRELGPIAELCKAYTHNHLAQVLRQAALAAKIPRPFQGRHRIPVFNATLMAAALQGLQLGRAAKKKPQSLNRRSRRHPKPNQPAKTTEATPGSSGGACESRNVSPSLLEERRTRKASVNSLEQTMVNNCRRDEPENRVLPNGDLIRVTGTNGRYAIHGIKAQHAQMPALQPNQRRLFKIHLAWSAVPEMELPEVLLKQGINMPKYNVQQIPHHAEGQYLPPSDWINPDHLEDDILQLGAIQFPELADAPDGLPIITFVAIQWREYQGLRPKDLTSCTTVTVAELLEYRDGKVTHLDHKFRRRALRPRRPRAINRPALREPLTPAERIKKALARIPLRE